MHIFYVLIILFFSVDLFALDRVSQQDNQRKSAMMADSADSTEESLYKNYSKDISNILGQRVDLDRIASHAEREIMVKAIFRTSFLHDLNKTIGDYVSIKQLTDKRYKDHLIAVLAVDAVGRALVNGEIKSKENYDGIHTDSFKQRVLEQLRLEIREKTGHEDLLSDVLAIITNNSSYLQNILTDTVDGWADEVLLNLNIRKIRSLKKEQPNKYLNLICSNGRSTLQKGEQGSYEKCLKDPWCIFIGESRNNPWERMYLKGHLNDRRFLNEISIYFANTFQNIIFESLIINSLNPDDYFIFHKMLVKGGLYSSLYTSAEKHSVFLFNLPEKDEYIEHPNVKKSHHHHELASLLMMTGKKEATREAITLYELSASQGHMLSQNALGVSYGTGKYVKKDEKQAKIFYEQAAKQGYPIAQLNLAAFYMMGIGVEKNEELAIEWYTRAAIQGNVFAQSILGSLYIMKGNYDKAFQWLMAAAEQGDDVSLYNLGMYFENGLGNIIHLEHAFFFYKKSAFRDFALAQKRLGLFYEEGIVVEKNQELAIEWYTKAANQGDAFAICALARLQPKSEEIQLNKLDELIKIEQSDEEKESKSSDQAPLHSAFVSSNSSSAALPKLLEDIQGFSKITIVHEDAKENHEKKEEKERETANKSPQVVGEQAAKKVIENNPNPIQMAAPKLPHGFSFITRKKRRSFEEQTPEYVQKAILELCSDISKSGLGGKGIKAEWTSRGYYSFRLNEKDRLLLKKEGKEYLIVAFEGHYENDSLKMLMKR